jgi:hypothetical protein
MPAIKHHLDARAEQIAEQGRGDPDDLLSTIQVAAWLGVSVQFLEIGRSKGFGPPFIVVAPRVLRYSRQDILAWLATRTHARTSEYETKGVAGPGRPRAVADSSAAG